MIVTCFRVQRQFRVDMRDQILRSLEFDTHWSDYGLLPPEAKESFQAQSVGAEVLAGNHPRYLSVYASTGHFESNDSYSQAATRDTEPLAKSYSDGILTRLYAIHFQYARASL